MPLYLPTVDELRSVKDIVNNQQHKDTVKYHTNFGPLGLYLAQECGWSNETIAGFMHGLATYSVLMEKMVKDQKALDDGTHPHL